MRRQRARPIGPQMQPPESLVWTDGRASEVAAEREAGRRQAAARAAARGPREIDIQQAILLAIGARPDLRIWRNNVGVATGANGRPIRFGTPGSADIFGVLEIIPGLGRFVALEVKSPTGRLRPEQLAWSTAMRGVGAACYVVRSPEDAVNALKDARLESLLALRAFLAGDPRRLDAAIEEARNG